MHMIPGFDFDSPPFDLLDEAARARLAAAVDLGYFAAGSELLAADAASAHVFVLLKGQVHAFARGGRRFADYGKGDLFGAYAVISGRARHTYVAVDDVICFLIPAETFRALLACSPRFSAWFNEGLSSKRRLAAEQDKGAELTQLMLTRVRDAQLAPLVCVPTTATLAQAAEALKVARVDCLLVHESGVGAGIVTRTDLLDAMALQGMPASAPVGPIAKRPLVTVRTDEVLFQALVTMTEHHIERVVVRSGDDPVGTLGMAEVLAHYASTSHLINLRLARADTIEQVAEASAGMTALIRTLHAQGAKMSYLTEMVSALNRRLMARVFDLLVPAELRAQVCLLVLGSEGRREQIIKTDQDNAVLRAEGVDAAALQSSMSEFAAALSALGWPPCPGRVMVDNPDWRLSAVQWQERIAGWARRGDGASMRDLAIAIDARPVTGDASLFAPVRAALLDLGKDQILMREMARATLEFSTPLTLFGQVREGQRGTDLKKGAIFPLVHGLRCLALQHRIEHNNSFDRATALEKVGALSSSLARDVQQALAVFMRLRLSQQLLDMEAGRAPGNRIDVPALRRLDRELLRDALRVVNDFKAYIQHSFQLRE